MFNNTGDNDGDTEQYEEELTAAEVLQKLEDAWLNEKHAPELLESRMEIVECMLDQVGDGNGNFLMEGFPKNCLLSTVHEWFKIIFCIFSTCEEKRKQFCILHP